MTVADPSTHKELQQSARELITEIYGVNLPNMANGFYVTLQLLAVAWGVENTDGEELFRLINEDAPLRFTLRTHDFARRLLNGEDRDIGESRKDNVSRDPETLEVLANVFSALTVQFDFSKGGYSNKQHLQPYLGQLIHHDYAKRPGDPKSVEKIVNERVYYRGGGTLVYEILRNDPDRERRTRIADGLRTLVADSDDALGKTAEILHAADALPRSDFVDRELAPYEEFREGEWTEKIRSGTARILHTGAPHSRKIDHLMYWLPYGLARHLLERAFTTLGEQVPAIPIDTGAEKVLRRESQQRFNQARNSFRMAIVKAAGDRPQDEERRRLHEEDFPELVPRKGNVETTLGAMGDFFSSTMACIGALNHNAGLRHYTLKLPLLEAIVHATVDAAHPLPFDYFCSEILFKDLGLVVDPYSGQKAGVTTWVDNEDLEVNAKGLADRLESLGLITSFSDATRMVGPRS